MFGILRRLGRKENVEITDTWPFGDEGGFAVLDFETTGLSPSGDRVIEVGLIKADEEGRPVAFFQTFINPEGPVGATHIHGITDADVANAPTFGEVSEELIKRLQTHVIVGHNLRFDMAFLDSELGKAGMQIPSDYPTICTYQSAKVLLPGLERHRLIDCAEALGLDNQGGHRALKDAGMTAGLLHAFLKSKIDEELVREFRALTSQARNTTWSTHRGAVRASSLAPRRPQPPVLGGQSEAAKAVFEGAEDLTPEDFLPDNPDPATLTYSELLLTTLEDGQVTADELKALNDLATSLGLTTDATMTIRASLLNFVAREAWRDGKVTKAEKVDVSALASILQLDEKASKTALAAAEQARIDRMNRKTIPLPADWALGAPLHVGDKVVFTGCYEQGRDEMEEKAARAGLRVTGSVSIKTKLLVSDGTINGAKDNNALKLGIRVVNPNTFAILLQYVQPKVDLPTPGSTPKPKKAKSAEPKVETLICTRCAAQFTRTSTRGRKPHECPTCRAEAQNPK
jgi:DNA polymerase-3 subunit epsilon